MRALFLAILFVPSISFAQCLDHSKQVTLSTYWKRGPGSCDDEIGVKITNNSQYRLVCSINIRGKDGRDKGLADTLRPGQTKAGEPDGLWMCGAAGPVSFTCLRSDNPRDDATCTRLLYQIETRRKAEPQPPSGPSGAITIPRGRARPDPLETPEAIVKEVIRRAELKQKEDGICARANWPQTPLGGGEYIENAGPGGGQAFYQWVDDDGEKFDCFVARVHPEKIEHGVRFRYVSYWACSPGGKWCQTLTWKYCRHPHLESLNRRAYWGLIDDESPDRIRLLCRH